MPSRETNDLWDLHHNGCLTVLREMPSDSLDSIVSDPPYGLSDHKPDDILAALSAWIGGKEYSHGKAGFMGKDWDSFVPGPEIWKECLRVLKPGGHVLAFAGTRTVDLMGMSLRIAGFEIRDSIAWMYGQGFPKSMDVSKALDKTWRGQREEVLRVTGWIRTRRDELGLTNKDLDAACGTMGMSSHWTSQMSQPGIPTTDMWAKLEPILGAAPDWMVPHIKPPREPRGPWKEREVIGRRTDGSLSYMGMGSKPSMAIEYDITAPASEEAKKWEGWGTALKPSFEPVLVGRKPLIGTLAHNILSHGVGGLNIDGCRVKHDASVNMDAVQNQKSVPAIKVGGANPGFSTMTYKPGGRWPPNTILSHVVSTDEEDGCKCVGTKKVKSNNAVLAHTEEGASAGVTFKSGFKTKARGVYGHADENGEEVVEDWQCVPGCPVAEVDDQSGILHNAYGNPETAQKCVDNPRQYESDSVTNFQGSHSASSIYLDKGGASRFYYTAKPSRSERTAGGRVVNKHVTVKPVSLMRYLCRLVTPPGGTVMDPFMGSGTTGVAALQEGFGFVGVEQDEDSFKTACGRIALWKEPGLWEDKMEIVAEPEVTSLEDLLGLTND